MRNAELNFMTKLKEDTPMSISVKIQKNYIDTENPIILFSPFNYLEYCQETQAHFFKG